MNKIINNMYINLTKTWYNKMKLSNDNIYIEDGKMYGMYNLYIEKNYFNDDEEEVIDEIIKDLETVKKRIKRRGKKI